jgi:hypothetical protein
MSATRLFGSSPQWSDLKLERNPMDVADDPNWWAKRRWLYNALLVLAGLTAFAGIVAAGNTVCATDPDFEITAFTTAFQTVGYAVAMGIANIFYGLGPVVERWVKPRNLSFYRSAAFAGGSTISVAAPLLVPLGLFVKCTLLL